MNFDKCDKSPNCVLNWKHWGDCYNAQSPMPLENKATDAEIADKVREQLANDPTSY